MLRFLLALALFAAGPALAQPADSGLLTQAESLPETAAEHDALARHHLAAGDFKEALHHAERAAEREPREARFWETKLLVLQGLLWEEKAASMTDSRRRAAARRLLALDPETPVALEETALVAYFDFEWRRNLSNRTSGSWLMDDEGGLRGSTSKALRRAFELLERALTAERGRASAHRLALRIRADLRDWGGLLDAAGRMADARFDDPDAWLAVGLGRFHLHDVAGADRAFDRALGLMPPEERTPFERLAGLLPPNATETPDAEAFWRGEDPRLLTPHNERRLEHLARLALADLLYREPGRRGWNTDRGRLVVRYGPPRYSLTWLSLVDGRYSQAVYDDFAVLLHDPEMTGHYDFASSAEGEDEATRMRSRFTREPVRSTYAPPGRTVFPFTAYAFRGEDGRTDLYVRYGLPTERYEGRLALRAGAFLLDSTAALAAEAHVKHERLNPNALEPLNDGMLWTDGLALSAAPGAYRLSVEWEQGGTGKVGYERQDVALPAFGSGLALSSLVPATMVEEAAPGDAASAGVFVRNGLVVRPAPWAVFVRNQPVYLYVEAYGLARDADGRTRYAVEVVLQAKDRRSFADRLLGRRAEATSVEFETGGTATTATEYVLLDVADEPPGPYTVTLRLTDRVSGQTAERATDLLLD